MMNRLENLKVLKTDDVIIINRKVLEIGRTIVDDLVNGKVNSGELIVDFIIDLDKLIEDKINKTL